MARRPPPQSPPRSARPSWLASVIVAAIAIAACAAGIANELAQDDIYLIAQNARIHDLSRIVEQFRVPFWPPPFSPDLYRPFTSVLLSIEFALGGGTPLIFRLVSYALYAAVAVQLLRFARLVLPEPFALAAALLFAVHPVHVEATALAVSQSELMVGLLALLMAHRYVVARRDGGLTARDWLILSLSYLAACLFKEQGIVLPLTLVAAEWLLVPAADRREWRRLLPGYATLAVVAAAVLIARRIVLGDVGGSFVAEALVGVPPAGRVLTMLRVVVAWLRLLVWPAHLQLDYAPQEIVASHSLGPREIAGLLILSMTIVTAWRLRRRAPAFSFAVAWCAVALAPVSNVLIPTGIVLAERTLFLPSIGFCLGVGALAELVLREFRELAARPGVARAAMTALGFLLLTGLARSAERQRVWRNDAVLAIRTVQDAPKSFRAQRVFADVALDLNQPQLALPAYERALELAPEAQRWRVRNDIARTYRRRGDVSTEAELLRASLAQFPAQEDTRGYLVAAELALGHYGEAALQADSALARGGSSTVFAGLRTLADSAEKASAPAGTIRVILNTGDVRRGP